MKADPRHPSIHLKQVGDYWSARAGYQYRGRYLVVLGRNTRGVRQARRLTTRWSELAAAASVRSQGCRCCGSINFDQRPRCRGSLNADVRHTRQGSRVAPRLKDQHGFGRLRTCQCAARPVGFGSVGTSARSGLVFVSRRFFVPGHGARPCLRSMSELRGFCGGEKLWKLRPGSRRAQHIAVASSLGALAGRAYVAASPGVWSNKALERKRGHAASVRAERC